MAVSHFDTNYLVDALTPGTAQEAKLFAWNAARESFGISTVAWSEFLCGPLSAADEASARGLLPQAAPLTREDAELAARLFNGSGRRSRTLANCQIAAIAIRCGATLATSNFADFEPFVRFGLRLA